MNLRNSMVTVGTLLVAAAVLALCVIFIGLFNVSARGGHWPLVEKILHTTYHNSVRLRAPPMEAVPDLSNNSLIRLGARHYQNACSTCHGEIDQRLTQTMKSMLPAPPPIRQAVEGWQPNHLHWIVTNGVKMSGMPHWPARERDDEVWAVVAFLSRVQEMSSETYREMVGIPAEQSHVAQTAEAGSEFPAEIDQCLMCHEADGSTNNDHIPRLDIFTANYLSQTLRAYRSGQRHSGIMQHAASTLDDEAIAAIARHFSSSFDSNKQRLAAVTDDDTTIKDEALRTSMERGALLARGAYTLTGEKNVPACNACHGPWPVQVSDRFPVIASQPMSFLLTQLQLWKAGKRGGTDLSRMMHNVVLELDTQQMHDLAVYYANLPLFRVLFQIDRTYRIQAP